MALPTITDRRPGWYVDCDDFTGRTRYPTRENAERAKLLIAELGQCRLNHRIVEVAR